VAQWHYCQWLSGHSEAFAVSIWLTMLPCTDSRGRFGDAWMSMTVSFGSEAEGEGAASGARRARQPASAPC